MRMHIVMRYVYPNSMDIQMDVQLIRIFIWTATSQWKIVVERSSTEVFCSSGVHYCIIPLEFEHMLLSRAIDDYMVCASRNALPTGFNCIFASTTSRYIYNSNRNSLYYNNVQLYSSYGTIIIRLFTIANLKCLSIPNVA